MAHEAVGPVHDQLRGFLHRRADVEIAGPVEDERPHAEQAADHGRDHGDGMQAFDVRVQRDGCDQRELGDHRDDVVHGVRGRSR